MRKKDPVLVALGHSVRKRREAKRLTQEVLAEKTGLDRTYISDIERGTRNVSILNVVRVARALGSSLSEITQAVDQ
ncbi:MAG TPA: helix-turn-helix transcriptional regulator [Verrucomicrobiota bacterium]|nr:helix-turn-helix transcriptional regulator [Verrucomicrobiota bacterium]HQL77649.1 helix-turn-helix transcriptional regulator [Verrucomicrobiota bacterium]